MSKKGWYQVVYDESLERWEVVHFTGTFTFIGKYVYYNIEDANERCDKLNKNG